MQQFLNSIGDAFGNAAAFIPTLLGAIVVFVVGWLIAALLKRLTKRGLESTGFNSLVQRGKVSEMMDRTGAAFEPAAVVASVVFWAVMIATLLLVANILGLVAISTLLTDLLAFLPNVLVAVVVLTVAIAVGQLAFELIEASIGGRVGGANILANIAKYGVIAFGAFIALNQLQISTFIVNSLFVAIVGALAVAFVIAFGIGNIPLAREISSNWYHKSRRTTEEIKAAKESEPPTGERPDIRRPAA